MRCSSCGAEIPEGMSVCLECGAIPDNTVVSQTTDTQEWRNNQKAAVKVESPGWMAGPLAWFTRLQGVSLLIYAYQLVTALILFFYLNHPDLLFSRSGADFFDFLDKSIKNVRWILIIIMILSVIMLLIMGSYGNGFWQAGLISIALVITNIITEGETDAKQRLIGEGVAVVLEIVYAVVLFRQFSRFTRPLDYSIADRWDRLLTLWIYAYIAAGALGLYMGLVVKTLKEMEICFALAYLLVFAIGLPVYKHLKRTYVLLRG